MNRAVVDWIFLALVSVGVAVAALNPGLGEVGGTVLSRLTTGFGFMISVSSIGLVVLLSALEHFFPARDDNRGFSRGIVFDALYLVVQLPIVAVLVALLATPVATTLQELLPFLVVDSTRSLPMLVVLVLGVLITDFTLFVSHVVRHKVPFLWRFHMIHHSQKRLNLFSASRDHPFDSLMETFIRLLPLAFLFPTITENAQALVLYGLGVSWHIRFSHTNTKTNMGPLRYILVTPQSHRIHHSLEEHHWNSNYGNLLAWDRLFGMQHEDVTSYPPTGINDNNFPEPESLSPIDFAKAYIGQLRFPFDAEAVSRATAARPAEEQHDLAA